MSIHETRELTYGLTGHGRPPVPDGLGGAAGLDGFGGLALTTGGTGRATLGLTGATEGRAGALDLSSTGMAAARLVIRQLSHLTSDIVEFGIPAQANDVADGGELHGEGFVSRA